VSAPIVFISTFRIKEGKLDAFKEHFSGNVPHMEATKPGTAVFYGYLNETGNQLKIVHMFPDAEAMDAHVEGVGERAKKAFEFIEPLRWDVYGSPSDGAMEPIRQAAQKSGAELVVYPSPLAGYAHLSAA
jgi:quinol monooxygenase YgiN